MRPHGTQEQLEKRRRRAIELLGEGIKPPVIAQKLGCSVSSVKSWRQQHQQQGEEGLKSQEVPGRPAKLNERQRKKLVDILLQGAVKSGYVTELWTTRRVAEVIKQRFGVEYHPNHVWRLLIGLGWSCQKPEKKAREQNEQEVRHWKKYRWPHIKKVPKKERSPGVS